MLKNFYFFLSEKFQTKKLTSSINNASKNCTNCNMHQHLINKYKQTQKKFQKISIKKYNFLARSDFKTLTEKHQQKNFTNRKLRKKYTKKTGRRLAFQWLNLQGSFEVKSDNVLFFIQMTRHLWSHFFLLFSPYMKYMATLSIF